MVASPALVKPRKERQGVLNGPWVHGLVTFQRVLELPVIKTGRTHRMMWILMGMGTVLIDMLFKFSKAPKNTWEFSKTSFSFQYVVGSFERRTDFTNWCFLKLAQVMAGQSCGLAPVAGLCMKIFFWTCVWYYVWIEGLQGDPPKSNLGHHGGSAQKKGKTHRSLGPEFMNPITLQHKSCHKVDELNSIELCIYIWLTTILEYNINESPY